MLLGQDTTTNIFDQLLGGFDLGTLGTTGLIGLVVFGFVAWWVWRWWRGD